MASICVHCGDVTLKSSFSPLNRVNGRWYAFSNGANVATKTITFPIELPNDAVPREQDEAKGIKCRVMAILTPAKSSMPYGYKQASISPVVQYITKDTKSVNVRFTFQSDCGGGDGFPDSRTRSSTLTFHDITLTVFYDSASNKKKNNKSGKSTYYGSEEFTEYASNVDVTTDASALRTCITAYEKDDTDWTTNGLGILQPKSCIVTQQAGGSWELDMTHPIDDEGRWKLLEVDRVIRAPVPIRQNPEAAIARKAASTSTHNIYKTKQIANLREKAAFGKSVKCLKKLVSGEEVEVLETLTSFVKAVASDGTVGYISIGLVEFVRQEETTEKQADGEEYNSVVTAQQTRNQCFRIYNVETDSTSQEVHVQARHVSYDFASNLIVDELKPSKQLLSTFLGEFRENLAVTDERSIMTDITNKYVSGQYSYTNPLNVLLDPENGIVSQLQCQLVRDNHSIYLLDNSAPADRGYTISYGKNLKSLKWSYNTEEMATRIMPTGQTSKGKPLLLPDKFVDSTHINDYPVVRCSRLQVSEATEGGEYTDDSTGVAEKNISRSRCFELMRAAAQKELDNGCDLPKIDVEVDFTALETTEEYADLEGLYQLYLYDTVHIRHDPLGYSADAQVYETQYDCILGRYNSIKLGDIFKQNTSNIAGYQISEGSVSGSRIAPSTITGTNLADATITNAKIGLASITAANIHDINADSITAGTLTTNRLVVTGEASIAGQLNTESAAAITAGTADKTNSVAYVANDALAVTDEGLVMKSGGKIQIVAGAEFTVDSSNLDIDENGTLECRNASISGSVSVNGSPVLTRETIYIGTNAPTNPVNGMVWIQPAGGSTACRFEDATGERRAFDGVQTYTLTGTGAAYAGTDARYEMTIPFYRSTKSQNTYYLRATISDGTNTIDLGSYPIDTSVPVGTIMIKLNGSGAWVCAGSSVTLNVWCSYYSSGTGGVMHLSSTCIAGSGSLALDATAAGGSSTGWQNCSVKYYQA